MSETLVVLELNGIPVDAAWSRTCTDRPEDWSVFGDVELRVPGPGVVVTYTVKGDGIGRITGPRKIGEKCVIVLPCEYEKVAHEMTREEKESLLGLTSNVSIGPPVRNRAADDYDLVLERSVLVACMVLYGLSVLAMLPLLLR